MYFLIAFDSHALNKDSKQADMLICMIRRMWQIRNFPQIALPNITQSAFKVRGNVVIYSLLNGHHSHNADHDQPAGAMSHVPGRCPVKTHLRKAPQWGISPHSLRKSVLTRHSPDTHTSTTWQLSPGAWPMPNKTVLLRPLRHIAVMGWSCRACIDLKVEVVPRI